MVNYADPEPDAHDPAIGLRPDATVGGTAGADFIHVAGDGYTPPDGYNEIAEATDGDDVITPGGGGDIVHAGGGDDQIVVNSSSDIDKLAEYLDGGEGNDSLSITVSGALDLSRVTLQSIETVSIRDQGLTHLVGSDMADLIVAGTSYAGDETIDGGDGDDAITYYAYEDIDDDHSVVHGGAGNDTILSDVGGLDDVEISGNHFLTIYGDGGDDHISGTDQFAEYLYGGDGDDWISGGVKGWADDELWGGAGADQFALEDHKRSKKFGTIEDFSHGEHDRINLAALDGNTHLKGHNGFHLGGATFTGSEGELIQFTASDGTTWLQGDENGDGSADFTISLVGNPTLLASDIIDTVDGGDGADNLVGGPMNDIMDGQAGDDMITGGQGQDVLTGGTGADTFIFKTTNGTAPGRYDHDTITDFAHADGDRIDLSGIDGDTLTAGHQGFTLGGAAFTGTAGELIQAVVDGQTFLQGDVDGDGKADFAIALDGAPMLVAGDFVDRVEGTNGADTLAGGPTNDIIKGKGGDDLITGGLGQDAMTGGKGADTFVFRTIDSTPTSAPDKITDFHHGEQDRIDLSGIDADTTQNHDQAFHLVAGSAFSVGDPGELIQIAQGGNTFIQGDVDGDGVADFQITLTGTHTLGSADFIL